MEKKKLVIIGVGETADIAYEYFTNDSSYEVVGFAVEKQYKNIEKFKGQDVICVEDINEIFPKDDFYLFVAISSSKLNTVRQRIYENMKNLGYSFATYVSSHAFVWKNVEIGENSFVFENNTLQPGVKIGNNVILWSGNHIGHHSFIGSNSFVSSHVVISGYCTVGENVFLGVNSTIINNIKIGDYSFVGAGALIQKDVPCDSVIQEESSPYSKVASKRLFKIR